MASVLESTRPATTGAMTLRNGDVLDQRAFHERYLRMPAGFRAELVGGVVYVPSPVTNWHAVYHADAIAWLGVYRMHTPGVDVLDNGTVILDGENEPQPDSAVRLNESFGGTSRITREGYVAGPPELHVEIAYASESIDMHQKKRAYAAAGVREYLVVLIRERAVRAFRLENAQYAESPPEADGIWRSRSFPGLWLSVPALLDRDGPKLLEVLNLGLQSPEHRSFVEGKPASR